MPKKTKKEKLLARYHKRLRLLEDKQIKTPEVLSKPLIIEETKTKIIETPQYFFSDLKKSLLLIFLILGIEIGLYFSHFIK